MESALLWLDMLLLWGAFVVGLVSYRRAEARYVAGGREIAEIIERLAREVDRDRARADDLAARVRKLDVLEQARHVADVEAFDAEVPTGPGKRPPRRRGAGGVPGGRR